MCEIFFINSVSFCYYLGSYGPFEGALLIFPKVVDTKVVANYSLYRYAIDESI